MNLDVDSVRCTSSPYIVTLSQRFGQAEQNVIEIKMRIQKINHVLTLYSESSVSEAIRVGRDIVDRYSLRYSDIRSLSF
jgi:hypothetical protein